MFKSKQTAEQTLVGLSDAELDLVAGGQGTNPSGPLPPGGSTAVAVGAAASNSADVSQANAIAAVIVAPDVRF
jgi:hypothetical protein